MTVVRSLQSPVPHAEIRARKLTKYNLIRSSLVTNQRDAMSITSVSYYHPADASHSNLRTTVYCSFLLINSIHT